MTPNDIFPFSSISQVSAKSGVLHFDRVSQRFGLAAPGNSSGNTPLEEATVAATQHVP